MTPRQREVLEAFKRLQVQGGGRPPTVRELCVEVGLASSSTVQNHLHSLTALGYLTAAKGRVRGLQLVSAPGAPCPLCGRG